MQHNLAVALLSVLLLALSVAVEAYVAALQQPSVDSGRLANMLHWLRINYFEEFCK